MQQPKRNRLFLARSTILRRRASRSSDQDLARQSVSSPSIIASAMSRNPSDQEPNSSSSFQCPNMVPWITAFRQRAPAPNTKQPCTQSLGHPPILHGFFGSDSGRLVGSSRPSIKSRAQRGPKSF
jgi:hypothetical protein